MPNHYDLALLSAFKFPASWQDVLLFHQLKFFYLRLTAGGKTGEIDAA
jgi:hypothetical protein